MASNISKKEQTDFTGGVNDALPPDQIEDNQLIELVNFLPLEGSHQLALRHGFEKKLTFADEVLGMHVGERTFYAVRNQGGYDIYKADGLTALQFPENSGQNTDPDAVIFTGYMGGLVFFTDGEKLFVINADYSIAKVQDFNKTGSGIDVEGFSFITTHRGRIWGIRDKEVAFCGTDDDTRAAGKARWQNWYPYAAKATWSEDGATMLTRAEVTYDDGSSMLIPPYDMHPVALASTPQGLLVLLDGALALWQYPDAAAPYEVEQGASIETIDSSVGCASADSLAYDGYDVYFIGVASSERASLFRFRNGEVTDLGIGIPERWKNISLTGQLGGEIVGNRYHVFTDNGVELVYDIRADAWIDFDTPHFTRTAHPPAGAQMLLADSDGVVWAYPSNEYTDDDQPIPFTIASKQWVPNGWFEECKFRKAYFRCGAVGKAYFSMNVEYDTGTQSAPIGQNINEDIPVWRSDAVPGLEDEWKDLNATLEPEDYYLTSVPTKEYPQTLNARGHGAIIRITGQAEARMYVNALGIGYRTRQAK